jgi:hypothetical protein
MSAAMTVSNLVAAEQIASCGSSKGYTFFNDKYPLFNTKQGFNLDGIDGYVILESLPDNKFDIKFKDIRGLEISALSSGAEIKLLRFTKDNIAIEVLYPNTEIEIYNFFVDKKGKKKYTVLKNKANKSISQSPYAANSSALFSGSCELFNPN